MTAFELAAQLYNMAVDGADGTISAADEPLPRSGYAALASPVAHSGHRVRLVSRLLRQVSKG